MKAKFLFLPFFLTIAAQSAHAQIIGLYQSTEKSKLTISVKKNADGEVLFRITARDRITCDGQEPVDFARRAHFAQTEFLPDEIFDEAAADKEDNSIGFGLWVPKVCLERFAKNSKDPSIHIGDVDYIVKASDLFTHYAGSRSPAERFKNGDFSIALCFQQAQEGDFEYHGECIGAYYTDVSGEEKLLYSWHKEDREPIM